MNPQDQYQNPTNQVAPQKPVNNPLAVMQPGEQIICEIKRHPIGMLGVYFMSGLVLIVLAVLAFVVAPNVITSVSSSEVIAIGTVLFFVAALLCLGFVFVSNKVYWGNRWILTSDSITQISQTSLLGKQSSQLSLGNLEDVTAVQDGALAHMFHYGVLKVETAGDRSKFMFLFCPNPDFYAQQVLGARERFEQGRHGEDEQRLYRSEDAYQPPSAPDQYGTQPQPVQPAAPQPAPGQNPPYAPPQTNPMPPGYGYNNGGPNETPGVNTNTE